MQVPPEKEDFLFSGGCLSWHFPKNQPHEAETFQISWGGINFVPVRAPKAEDYSISRDRAELVPTRETPRRKTIQFRGAEFKVEMSEIKRL